MTENIVARHLMLENLVEIQADSELHKAMGKLIELQDDPQIPTALIVIKADGLFEGVLTARLLFKSLLTLWMPGKAVREDVLLLEKELLSVVKERLQLRVQDTLVRGFPVAAPDDRLLTLIELGCDKRMEFIPVIEDGRAIGLIPIASIFHATANLALTPEDEGIRMDGKTYK